MPKKIQAEKAPESQTPEPIDSVDDSVKSSSDESDHEELESVKSSIPANDFDILEDVAAKKTKKLKLDLPKARVFFLFSVCPMIIRSKTQEKLGKLGK